MEERVAIGFRCSHCQRPLPLRKRGIVACPACGGENYVELPPGAAAEEGSRTALSLVLGLVGVMALGAVAVGVFLFPRFQRSAPSWPDHPPSYPPEPPRRPPPLRAEPGPRTARDISSWSGGSEGPCVASIDGATIVVGAAASEGLTAIRARSGEIAWQNAGITHESGDLRCDGGEGMILASRKDFRLRAVDPRTGAERWSTRLSDAPDTLAFGDGCVVATAIDKSQTALSLATGAPASCAGARPVRKAWDEAQAPVVAGGVQISFSTVAQGSPRIVVTATRGGAPAWTQTLSIAAERHRPAPHALSKAGLLLAGSVPGEQAMGMVLIDPATGRTIASREIRQKESHGEFFVHLAATDREVFFQTFGKLYAFTLPDLLPLWEAGSFW
jgi:hypothetical protein